MGESSHHSFDVHGTSTLTSAWTHFGDIGKFPQQLYDFQGILLLSHMWEPLTRYWSVSKVFQSLVNFCYFFIIFKGYLEKLNLAMLAYFCDFVLALMGYCYWLH